MQAKLENSAVATGQEKVSFHSSTKDSNAKEYLKSAQLSSFHMLARSSPKSYKLGFNSAWIKNFQMFKLDLEKAEEPEIKLPTSAGSSEKQESSRKTSNSASLTMTKPLTAWSQ